MKTTLSFHNKSFTVDMSQPLDISIPLNNGNDNPNCYWADPVLFETIIMGDFIGSVEKGGPVNYQKLHITPHGNGTHTECFGHISDDPSATINRAVTSFFGLCLVISLTPEVINADHILPIGPLKEQWPTLNLEAVAIRTLPNSDQKLTAAYSGSNPPYLNPEIGSFLNDQGVKHLLVDLPSVDKEVDGGKLSAHRQFWGFPDQIRKEATITELIYIPNEIPDGVYLLNLQTINLSMDASPSRPVLYKIDGF